MLVPACARLEKRQWPTLVGNLTLLLGRSCESLKPPSPQCMLGGGGSVLPGEYTEKMATSWIVNATPGDGPVPNKAIDIILYGAGSGGDSGPVGLDDVSGSITIQGSEVGPQTAAAWIEGLYTTVQFMSDQITDLQTRVEELENAGEPL